MLFSQYIPFLGLLAGLSQASPAALSGNLEALTLKPAVFHLGHTWDDEVLFNGLVNPPTKKSAGVSVGIALPKAAIAGDISMRVTDRFLKEPTVIVSLGGVQAYFEVDFDSSASVFETIELATSGRLALDIPGFLEVDVGTAFALDFYIGVSAATKVTGGFFVSFPEDAFVEISILTKRIIHQSWDGLVAQPLDLSLGDSVDLAAAVDLTFGLRLRSAVGIGADIGILGLDLLDTSAGVAIWFDLFSYKTTLVKTASCPVYIKDSVAMGQVGVSVDFEISVAEALSLEIAPSIFVTISRAEIAAYCQAHAGPSDLSSNKTAAATAIATVTATALPHLTSSRASALTTVAPSVSGNLTKTNPARFSNGTTTSTKTYTITSCMASVINCPASLTQIVVTSTVVVCPVEPTAPATTTPVTTPAVPQPTTQVTTITLTSCNATSTFTEPEGIETPVPTVTITDDVTVCPSSATDGGSTPTGQLPKPIGTGGVYPSQTSGDDGPYPTGGAQPPSVVGPTAQAPSAVLPPAATTPGLVTATSVPPVLAGATKVFAGFAGAAMLPVLAVIL